MQPKVEIIGDVHVDALKKLPKKLQPASLAFQFPKYHKASDVLKMALKIISAPGRWIQDDLAESYLADANLDLHNIVTEIRSEITRAIKQDHSLSCSTKSRDAHAFCALGAV